MARFQETNHSWENLPDAIKPQLEIIKRSKTESWYKSKIGWHPDGWLLLLDKTFGPYLMKLLPHTRIQLPKLDGYYTHSYNGIIMKPRLYVRKNNPSSCYQEDLIVIIRYAWAEKLSFWRPGNRRWTCLGEGYTNMTSHNYTLYALKVHGFSNTAMIEAWDFIGSRLPKKKYSIQVPYDVSKFQTWEWSCHTRLKILPITKEILILAPKRRFCVDFPKWFVFKVDMSLRQCIPVTSLYGAALILCRHCSILISSNDVEHYGYKPNSVYYLNYKLDHSKDRTDIILSNYGLEDGQIQQIFGPLCEFGRC